MVSIIIKKYLQEIHYCILIDSCSLYEDLRNNCFSQHFPCISLVKLMNHLPGKSSFYGGC